MRDGWKEITKCPELGVLSERTHVCLTRLNERSKGSERRKLSDWGTEESCELALVKRHV